MNPESFFLNTAGLKMVEPSTAYDAKGLLIEAIRDPDPVIFIEHKRLYMRESEVPEESYTIPFGVARVAREGTDVTVVGIQKMVHTALEAADGLAQEGISVEVPLAAAIASCCALNESRASSKVSSDIAAKRSAFSVR